MNKQSEEIKSNSPNNEYQVNRILNFDTPTKNPEESKPNQENSKYTDSQKVVELLEPESFIANIKAKPKRMGSERPDKKPSNQKLRKASMIK